VVAFKVGALLNTTLGYVTSVRVRISSADVNPERDPFEFARLLAEFIAATEPAELDTATMRERLLHAVV
jgi:hypothetical protein